MNGLANSISGASWAGVMINEGCRDAFGNDLPAGSYRSSGDVMEPQGKLKYHHQDSDKEEERRYKPSCDKPGTFCFENLDAIPEIHIFGM